MKWNPLSFAYVCAAEPADACIVGVSLSIKAPWAIDNSLFVIYISCRAGQPENAFSSTKETPLPSMTDRNTGKSEKPLIASTDSTMSVSRDVQPWNTVLLKNLRPLPVETRLKERFSSNAL